MSSQITGKMMFEWLLHNLPKLIVVRNALDPSRIDSIAVAPHDKTVYDPENIQQVILDAMTRK